MKILCARAASHIIQNGKVKTMFLKSLLGHSTGEVRRRNGKSLLSTLQNCRSGAATNGRQSRPRLEMFEERCLPTIITAFNAVTGALTLTGSAGDNTITVTESSATTGDYTVAATDGVTGPTAFTGVKSIVINTEGQATATGDSVHLVGNAGANSFLRGSLRITGADTLKVGFGSNFNVAGAVTITKTSNTGRLTVQTGPPASAAIRQANISLGNTVISNVGTGGTTVAVGGASQTNDMAFTGSLAVTMGSGTNTFSINSATVVGNVNVFSAQAGVASVTLDQVIAGRSITVNGTAASSGINLSMTRSVIGRAFAATSGSGADSIGINSTSVLGQGLLPGQPAVALNLKGGANTTNIGLNGANADNLINGSFSYLGTGVENFSFSNYSISSSFTLVGSSIQISGGNFLNNVIGGNATLTSKGAGVNDLINLGALLGAVIDASNELTIGQTLTLNVGSGSDTVNVNNASVGRDCILNASGAVTTATISNTTVGRNLAVRASANTDDVVLSLGKTAAASTGAVSVLGNLSIITGVGADVISLRELTVLGASTLSTNAGADTVDIETTATTNVGPSQFFGAVSLLTGADSDTITLGFDASNSASFFKTLLINGGADSDTVTEIAVHYYGGPPTLVSIP